MKSIQKIDDNHYKELIKIEEDCANILKECGINPIESKCTFHFNSSYGRYYPKDNLITVSYNYYNQCKQNDTMDDIYNIIIHEKLHAIAESNSPNSGHTGAWKKLANVVSKNTKYKISRLYNFGLMNEEDYKYIIECQNCGQRYGHKKRPSIIDEIQMGFVLQTCSKCNSNNFKIIK